jgi:hypothetical protein
MGSRSEAEQDWDKDWDEDCRGRGTPRRTTRHRYFPYRFHGESNTACPADGGGFNLRSRPPNSLRFPPDQATR